MQIYFQWSIVIRILEPDIHVSMHHDIIYENDQQDV